MHRRFAGKAPYTGGRGVDYLGALPDEILPSRDAVRTCVLARRWRHLWKSTAALRVTNVDAFRSARHVNQFVNHLIVLRDRTPLRECEIAAYKEYDVGGYYDSNGDRGEHSQYIDLWVRYALSCHARLLRITDHDPNDLDAAAGYDCKRRSVMLEVPVFSGHLTTLELDGVVLSTECSNPLDFLTCPNLETLKMSRCSLLFFGRDRSMNISSQSMRCLSITDCGFDHFNRARALISVPSLVHLDLQLTDHCALVPAFQSIMPSLLTTSIKLDRGCKSSWRSLKRKALKRCTTFTNLKTLSLNEWCVEPDFGPLLYFLRRSPNLEKLNIRLSKPYRQVEEAEGCYDSAEPLLASKHFRVVEIKCQAKDERVHKILKVLSSYGLPAEQINIKKII